MKLVTFFGVLVTALCLTQITQAANLNGRRGVTKEKRQSGAVGPGYASSSLNLSQTPVYTAPRSRGDGDEAGNEVDATTTIVYEDEPDREEEGTSEDYQYVPGTTQTPGGEEEGEEKSGGGYGPSLVDDKMKSGQGGYRSSGSGEQISGGYGATRPTSMESLPQFREQPSGGYDYTPTSRQGQGGEEKKKADYMETKAVPNPSQANQERPMDQQQIENFSRTMSVQPPSRAYQLPSSQGSVGNYRAYYGPPAYLGNSLLGSEQMESGSGGYGSRSPVMEQEYFPAQPFRPNGDSPMFSGGRQESSGFSTSSAKPTTFYGSPNEIIPQPTSYLPPSSNAYQTIQAVEYRPESRVNQGGPQRFSQQQDGGKSQSNSGVGYYLPPQQSYSSERREEERQPQSHSPPSTSQPQPSPTYQPTPSSTTSFYSNDNTFPQNQYPAHSQPQQSQFQSQLPESRPSDAGHQQTFPPPDNRNLQSAPTPLPASPSAPTPRRTGGFQLDFDEFHDNDNVVDAELIQRVQQIIEEHERQQKELKEKLRQEYEASEAGFFGNSYQNSVNQQQYGPPQLQQQQQYAPQQQQQYGPPQQAQQHQYAAPQEGQQQQYAAPQQQAQQQQYGAPQQAQQQQYGAPQQSQQQSQAQLYQSPGSQPEQKYSPAQASTPQTEHGPPAGRNNANSRALFPSATEYQKSVSQETNYSGPPQERENYYSEPTGSRNSDSKEQSALRSDTNQNDAQSAGSQAKLPGDSQAQAGSRRQNGGSKRLGNIEYQKAILTDHFVETAPGPYNPVERSRGQFSSPQTYSGNQGQSSPRFPLQASAPGSSQFIRTQEESGAPAQVAPGLAFPSSGNNNYFLSGVGDGRNENPQGRVLEEPEVENRNVGTQMKDEGEQSASPLPVYGPVSFQSRGNIDVPDFSSLGQFISPEQAQEILASTNGQFNNPQEQAGYRQSFPPTGNTRTIILHELPAYPPLPSPSPLSNNILINPSEFDGNSRVIPSSQYGNSAPPTGPTSAPSPTNRPDASQSSPPSPAYSRPRGEQGGESPFLTQPQSYNQQPEGFINSAYTVQPRESDIVGDERETELQIGYLFPQTSSFIPQRTYGIESLNLNQIPVSSPKPIYGIPLAPALGLESFSQSSSQAVSFGQQHSDNFPPPPQSPEQYEQNHISSSTRSQSQYQPLPTSYGIPYPQQYTFSSPQPADQHQQLSPISSYPGSQPEGEGQILSWESFQPANQDNTQSELSSHSLTPVSQTYGLRTTSPHNNNNQAQQRRYPSPSSQPKPESSQHEQSQGGYSSRYPRRSRRIVRKNVSRRSTTTTTTTERTA